MDHPTREDILNQSDNNPVGLIYSRSDLQHYLVEVIDHHNHHYIEKRHNPVYYNTVDDALKEAQKQGAKTFYLCLDNTYDECGAPMPSQRFSYLQLYPKDTEQ